MSGNTGDADGRASFAARLGGATGAMEAPGAARQGGRVHGGAVGPAPGGEVAPPPATPGLTPAGDAAQSIMAMLAALQASIAAIQVQGTENAAAVAVLAARVDAAEAPNGWHTPVDTPARTFVLPLAGTPAPGSLATPVAGSPRLSGVAGARGTTAVPGGPITATFAQAVTTGTGSTSTSTATQDEKAMYNALPRLKDSTSSVLLGGAADVVDSPLASFHKQVMSFMKAFPNSGLGLRALVSPEAMSALGTETAFYEVTKNDVPATDADLMSGILALLMSRTGPTSEALLRSFKNVLGSSKFGAAPTRDASLAAMDALAGAAEALCTTQGSGEVHSQAVAIFLAESNNLVAPATRRLLTQLLCAGGPAATAAGGSATGKLDDLIMSWPDFVRAVKSHMNADRVLSSQLDAAYGARRLDGATGATHRTGVAYNAAQRTGVAFSGAPERGRSLTRPTTDRYRSSSAPRVGSRAPSASRAPPCGHCGKPGHPKESCWTLHPEQRPKDGTGSSNPTRGASNTTGRGAAARGGLSRGGAYSGSRGGHVGAPRAPSPAAASASTRRVHAKTAVTAMVPWHPSCNSITQENPLVATSAGAAFFDSGADTSFIARSAMGGLAGLRVREMTRMALTGAVSGEATQAAEFQISIFLSRKATDGPFEPDPTTREYGGGVTACVVDDAALAGMDVGGVRPTLVLGRDSMAWPWAKDVWLAHTKAMSETGWFSHTQKPSVSRRIAGKTLALEAATAVADVYEGGGVAEIVRDGLAVINETVFPARDVDGRTLSRQEVADMIYPRLGDIGRKYAETFIDVIYEHRAVLGSMRAGTASTGIAPRVQPGTQASKAGLLRPVQPKLRLPVWEETMRIMKKGAVEETTNHEGLWLLPVVVAVRADGRIRMCLDARALNEHCNDGETTVLPSTKAHLLMLAEFGDILSCLDLPDAYLQMPVDAAYRDLFGFCVTNPYTNQYVFLRFTCCIFGFMKAPGAFQDFVQNVLVPPRALSPNTVIPGYLDNTDIASKITTNEHAAVVEHLRALGATLGAYATHGLVISIGKSTFGATTIKTMGAVVSRGVIRIDPERLAALSTLCEEPDAGINIKWLQHVLGTLNHVSEHVGPGYALNADCLFSALNVAMKTATDAYNAGATKAAASRGGTDALRAVWDDTHRAALRKLIGMVADGAELITLDGDRPVYASMDASDHGVGGSVGQYRADGTLGLAIVFCRRFTPLQRLWSVGARELYGWLCLLRKHWRDMIGYDVVWRGDHLNLLTVEDLENTHVQRWLAELICFPPWTQQFRGTSWTARIHTPGVCIALCDFLSRYAPPEDSWSPTASGTDVVGATAATRRVATQRTFVDDAAAGRETNAHTSALSPYLLSIYEAQQSLDTATRETLITETGATEATVGIYKILFVGQRVLIPSTAKGPIEHAFRQVHDYVGHPEPDKALRLLLDAKIYIPGVAALFRKWYDSCSCQLARAGSSPRPSNFIVRPHEAALDHIFMDFASLVETATDKNGDTAGDDPLRGVLVIVDSASRYARGFVVPAFTAENAINSLKTWVRWLGVPRKVSVDGGRHFANKALDSYVSELGALLDVGTPHHPQGRGLVERRIGMIKNILKKSLKPGKTASWPMVIDDSFQHLASLPTDALGGISPLEYLFGRKPSALWSADCDMNNPQAVEDRLLLLQGLRWLADTCSDVSAAARAATAREAARTTTFSVGDHVGLFYPTRNDALSTHFVGPFVVKARDKDSDFYVVSELLAGGQHGKPVRTHANRLVPYNMGRTSADDLHQNKLPSGYYVVAAILNGPRNDDGLFEVSWKHTQTTTWEPAVALRQVVLFRKYCDERGLDYDGKTKPTVDERGGDKTATSSVADSAGSGSRRSGRTRPNSQRR